LRGVPRFGRLCTTEENIDRFVSIPVRGGVR
jgi:hypothetical protein